MIEVISFQSRAGDRNDRAVQGARLLGEAIGSLVGKAPRLVGTPSPVIAGGWEIQLADAMADLKQLAEVVGRSLDRDNGLVLSASRCAASIATLPQVAARHPQAAIVWFDAHGDCNIPREGLENGYLGGMVISGSAGLWQTGLGGDLTLDQVILVGSRDLDPFERELIEAGRLTVLGCGPALDVRLIEAVAGRQVYIHLDCDVLQPGLVPTEYQVEGGLTFRQLRHCFEALASCEVLGLEVAELEACWRDGSAAEISPLLAALTPVVWRLAGESPRD